MKLSFTSALVLVFIATVTFYSCARMGSGSEERVSHGDVSVGGVLTVTVSTPIGFVIPSAITDASSSEIGTHIHCGLVNLDPGLLDVVPAIAESWSIDDKKTSYVFNLRKGVLFHKDACFGSGNREITAEDFKYSFEQLCGQDELGAFETTFANRVEGADAFHNGEASEISGVQVIDDYTLRIRLIKPEQSFLFVLAQPSTAAIAEKAMLKYGSESKIGAGPFVMKTVGKEMLLVRNDEYYQTDAFGNHLPYLDTLIVKTVSTKSNQLEQFLEGQLDVVSGLYLDPVRDVLESQMANFSGKNPKYIMVREEESAGYESYTIYRANLKGFGSNFMGYRNFSQVQIEQ